MNTAVLILLGIVVVTTLAFLVSLFKLSLDDADFWLKVISGVLAAFTFLAGAAALVTGTVLGNRQAEKIAGLDKATAEAKQKQAEAELQLEKLRLGQEPRAQRVTAGLRNALKGKPTGKAEVIYQENDAEVFEFAQALNMGLAASSWEVPFEPRPLDDMVSESWKDPRLVSILSRSMRVFASPTGLTIVANSKMIEAMDANKNTPATALQSALIALSFRVNTGVDDSLPDGFLRLVVMQKD